MVEVVPVNKVERLKDEHDQSEPCDDSPAKSKPVSVVLSQRCHIATGNYLSSKQSVDQCVAFHVHFTVFLLVV